MLLFNGKDLTGWTGDTAGFAVEDGVLVALKDGGGNLYVDRPFSDFVLRFAFRMEPGGNNGVGIRAEQGKDAAYHGMEIQILDDYAPQYADLQPYQYHGSVYGVVAAERGALRPAGEWNEEEIRAEGPLITVVLNGQYHALPSRVPGAAFAARSMASGISSTSMLARASATVWSACAQLDVEPPASGVRSSKNEKSAKNASAGGGCGRSDGSIMLSDEQAVPARAAVRARTRRLRLCFIVMRYLPLES